MPVNCWGPSVGAKAVSYRKAVLLGLVGQTVGMIAFGPNTYSAYGQFLISTDQLQKYPMLTMYAMMWMIAVPLLWHIMAIWQKIILPVYLGTGEKCPRLFSVKLLCTKLLQQGFCSARRVTLVASVTKQHSSTLHATMCVVQLPAQLEQL